MLVYLTAEERRDLARRYRLAYKDAELEFFHQVAVQNGHSTEHAFCLDQAVRFRKPGQTTECEGVIGLLVAMNDLQQHRDTYAVILYDDDRLGRRQYRVSLNNVVPTTT